MQDDRECALDIVV